MLFYLDHQEVIYNTIYMYIYKSIELIFSLETGTRWKDYILVTLLLSAIIGCWYAYQQNKCAKRHLRRMAKDMEGLQKAEQSLQEMQKVGDKNQDVFLSST